MVRNSRLILTLLLGVMLGAASAVFAEKEAILDASGVTIGYKETLQEGTKTIIVVYGPDGTTVLQRTSTEVEERDDGTIVTTVVEEVTTTRPDGTKIVTTTTTEIEEYPTGPIAKKIVETIIDFQVMPDGRLKPIRGERRITIVDRWGRILIEEPWKPERGWEDDIPPTPTEVGERE